MRRTKRVALGIAVALLALPFPGWAQDQGPEEDGPALGVARVSLTNGDVTMRHGDEGDWVQATVNSPLVEGDTVATGPGSRAEVQLDHSNLLRLGPNSEVNIANLANRQFRVQVARGLVTYSELRGGDADVDIETPLVAVRPGKEGRYRVEVHNEREVWVTVRKGEARIASPEGVETLEKGRRMTVRGEPGEDPEFLIAKAAPKDDWDAFNERRDKQLNKSESYRNVSSSIYGAEDLDDNGRWSYVSGYGNCWFPRVDYGWAPYRYGNWRYIDYYGWTWVSSESWGWAPYHYGRWFNHASFGWGWYPGPYYARHSWRPALVAFFGYNSYSGFNFGFGFGGGGHHYPYGHVGWVPLAPGERYHPWYRRGHGYGGGGRGGRGGGRNSVVVNNNVNIYNNYRNARINNGTTVIPSERFARGQGGGHRSLASGEMRRASVMRGQVPVIPESESRGNVVRRASARAASGSDSRKFFTTNRSRQRVQRTSFGRQREGVTQSVRAFADANPEATRAASGRRSGATPGTLGQSGADRGRGAGGTRAAIVSQPRSRATVTSPTRGAWAASTRRGAAGFPSATARSRAGSTGLSTTPGAVQGSTTTGPSRSSAARSGAGAAPGTSTRSPADRASGSSWGRFGGTTSGGSSGATVRSGRGRALGPSTRSSTATTSGSRSGGAATARSNSGGTTGSGGRSRVSTGGSRWRSFSPRGSSGSSGATVRSGRSESRSPSRTATRSRSFKLGDPVLNGRSSGRSTAAPRANSRANTPTSGTRRSSATPNQAGASRNPRTFTPRTRSRAATPRGTPQANRSNSGASRVTAPRSSSRSSGGFTPRTSSRAPSGYRSRSSASRSTSGSRGRVTAPRSSPRPSRPSMGRPSVGRSAPSVSRAPRMSRPSGGSYGRGRSSSPRSASPSRSSGSVSRGSVGRSSAGSRSSGAGRSSGARGRGGRR